jgi:ABC-type uncharacterized transport system involved in gliding motility auxiliary subunit
MPAGVEAIKGRYLKFLLYVVAVVLVNVVGVSLFVRADLTANKVYSLSGASREVVSNLSEPLTVKVFFTSDLPAPYNNIERYLHDILQEYAVAGNRYFNYRFYDVSGADDGEARENRELAGDYGIAPVQIQNIEQDELKFQKAYMGMAFVHGDIIEAIPTIASTEGLEYRITSTIRKMSNKISALLGLDEDVSVKLFLSSSLQAVGPYINISGIPEVPAEIERIVGRLNGKNYGRLSFAHLDPTLDREHEEEARRNDIMKLRWDTFRDRRGKVVPADRGYAGILLQHGERTEEVGLLSVTRIPIFGTQYRLADGGEIENAINEAVENVLDINEEIGYLADHGTHSLGMSAALAGVSEDDSLSNFNRMLSEQYSIRQVRLEDTGVPDDLPTLIISGAREKFSDHDLYLIDQYLMKGRNLAVFLDAYEEYMPPRNQAYMMFRQQPRSYRPVSSGLEKLLSHYGFVIEKSYVLDENCFKQRISRASGGGEQPVYFAPIIKNESISKEAAFLKNIKGLVMYKASPVRVDEARVKARGLVALRLFSSSDRAWEMKGDINLSPAFMRKPQEEEGYRRMSMAYVLEGPFPSYFADKPVPEKDEGGEDAGEESDAGAVDTSSVEGSAVKVVKGKPGRIFLVGTSEILKDNIIDEGGESPNSQFVMNVIDYLNGREELAVMRSKTQRFNPLREVKPATRTVIKTANIVGLPVLVILAGLVVWGRRASRKRVIHQIFMK